MMRGLVAGLAAGLLLASAAGAADIGVLPVGLGLGAGHDRAAVTVTNQGTEAVTIQVETVSWTQTDEGQDEYAPSRDLLINPPLFTIAPGKAQVLRVGLRRPPSGGRETAYRLFLREVPPPPAPTVDAANAGVPGVHIRVLLELRLPVYVAPTKVVRGQQWQGRRTTDGAIEVTMVNDGNVHMNISELALRAADATAEAVPLATVKAGSAVFPGQRRSWTLHPPTGGMPEQRFVLNVATDQGPQDVALDLGRP